MTYLGAKMTQFKAETTKLRDKINVIEQLLTTLTSTCAQPRHPHSSSEDPPSPFLPTFVH
jgi:hypothetical protein